MQHHTDHGGASDGRGRWNITLINQPSNSPGFNDLDLGFFNAWQSQQDHEAPLRNEELVALVEQACENIDVNKRNDLFLMYDKAMENSVLARGSNTSLEHAEGKFAKRKVHCLRVSHVICQL